MNMVSPQRVSKGIFGILAACVASSGWSHAGDMSALEQAARRSAASAQRPGSEVAVPARASSLTFVPDQMPKRAETVKVQDHPERLTAAIAALQSSPKDALTIPAGPPPLSGRPAALAWAPDNLGDVPTSLDLDRSTIKAEVK